MTGNGGTDTLRALARHQWVRDHGTPRVTVLVGRAAGARAVWLQWLGLSGRDGAAIVAPGPDAWHVAARAAMTRAVASPRHPSAITVERVVLERWLAGRDDRVAAFIAEGRVNVSPPRRPAVATRDPAAARSLAELALFDALEATPSTRGRFRLNDRLSVHFGSRAAEIDLLSRADEVAIEIDGYHHFTDLESYRRDRRKDLLLQAHGYVVLRFLAEDVLADPRDAVRAVCELLGRRIAGERVRRR